MATRSDCSGSRSVPTDIHLLAGLVEGEEEAPSDTEAVSDFGASHNGENSVAEVRSKS